MRLWSIFVYVTLCVAGIAAPYIDFLIKRRVPWVAFAISGATLVALLVFIGINRNRLPVRFSPGLAERRVLFIFIGSLVAHSVVLSFL